MKKLSNTEAELKKNVAYKKSVYQKVTLLKGSTLMKVIESFEIRNRDWI